MLSRAQIGQYNVLITRSNVCVCLVSIGCVEVASCDVLCTEQYDPVSTHCLLVLLCPFVMVLLNLRDAQFFTCHGV